jgi:hypothetical protein
MSLDRKILEELKRFNQINSYILNEQPEPPAPPAPVDPAADPGAEAPVGEPEGGIPPPADAAGAPPVGAPPAGGDVIPEPVDVENDPDVEEVGNEPKGGEGESEEIDITDLVTTQQEIQAKQDEFMDGIFSKLDDLESKLSHMDEIMDKISSLEDKFDKYREKTPEERLMLRSLDSYPFNQKLTDFFDDKKDEMEETGKNEYILTSDDVENFSPNEVKKTFNIYDKNDNAL